MQSIKELQDIVRDHPGLRDQLDAWCARHLAYISVRKIIADSELVMINPGINLKQQVKLEVTTELAASVTKQIVTETTYDSERGETTVCADLLILRENIEHEKR